jgi:hypothetical protein
LVVSMDESLFLVRSEPISLHCLHFAVEEISGSDTLSISCLAGGKGGVIRPRQLMPQR